EGFSYVSICFKIVFYKTFDITRKSLLKTSLIKTSYPRKITMFTYLYFFSCKFNYLSVFL
ncbi:MAG: hypothetical protein COY50_04455, partial [Deltaproteobacteria bacterium CG_4_10_14_0_8_um_filter_43_12]